LATSLFLEGDGAKLKGEGLKRTRGPLKIGEKEGFFSRLRQRALRERGKRVVESWFLSEVKN